MCNYWIYPCKVVYTWINICVNVLIPFQYYRLLLLIILIYEYSFVSMFWYLSNISVYCYWEFSFMNIHLFQCIDIFPVISFIVTENFHLCVDTFPVFPFMNIHLFQTDTKNTYERDTHFLDVKPVDVTMDDIDAIMQDMMPAVILCYYCMEDRAVCYLIYCYKYIGPSVYSVTCSFDDPILRGL